MPANSRWDLIRRLRVKTIICYLMQTYITSIYSFLPNTWQLPSDSCKERSVPLAACVGYLITLYTLPSRALLFLILLFHFLRLLPLILLLSFHLHVSTLRDSTPGKPDRRHFEAIVTFLPLWRFNRLHSHLFYSTRKTLHTEFTKNGLTETYFCNKKQNESSMVEGVFLNSGMQGLTISEGPRAFEP